MKISSIWPIAVVALFVITFFMGVIYVLLPEHLQMPFLKSIGLIIAGVCIFVIIVDLIFLLPTIGGAIYVPSKDAQVERMLKLAQIRTGMKAVDLGSGDGRIVIVLARAGAEAHGYEINPLLVIWSRMKVKAAGLDKLAKIHWASFWHVNFSGFQLVTLFGISYIMKDLEKKLQKELPPGSQVICNSFPFPDWQVAKKDEGVYLYQR